MGWEGNGVDRKGRVGKGKVRNEEKKLVCYFCIQGECDPSFGADFVYSVYEKELIIGEIFVRVYNEQPAYPLEV